MAFLKGLKNFLSFKFFLSSKFFLDFKSLLARFVPSCEKIIIDEVKESKKRRVSVYEIQSAGKLYEISSLKEALFKPKDEIVILSKGSKIILFCSQFTNNFDEVLLQTALRALICLIFAGVFVYFYVKNGGLGVDLFFLFLFGVLFLFYFFYYIFLIFSTKAFKKLLKELF